MANAPQPANWPMQHRAEVGERNFALLVRAKETLIGNVAPLYPSPPWHPWRGIRPSSEAPGYPGVWNWDAAFHAMAVARWDVGLAREQVRILLDRQAPSGALPDVVFTGGRVVTDFGKPPVMPWAVMIVDALAPDNAFLSTVYDPFVRYEEFWRRERGGDAEGLFHYDSAAADPKKRREDAKLESGWDNSVRWDDSCHGLWPIDLNCFMVMLYRSMALMARRAGRDKDVSRWEVREKELAAKINEHLYDETLGCYADVRRDTGAPTGVISPACLMPLFARIAPTDRARACAALARDPRKLYPAMPTVAYDHPGYRSNTYWRGPTWLNTAFFALKGLKQYGHDDLADAGRELILDWASRNTDSLHEYYDSRTGGGIGVGHFGWSAAFIIEFILNW